MPMPSPIIMIRFLGREAEMGADWPRSSEGLVVGDGEDVEAKASKEQRDDTERFALHWLSMDSTWLWKLTTTMMSSRSSRNTEMTRM